MKLFGTDGLRGIYGTELNGQISFNLGRALGSYANSTQRKNIVMGWDTRLSCNSLLYAMVSGIISQGADVTLVGVLPTPAISFIVKEKHFDFGVMITASHNSAEYNGIKVFGNDGTKLNRVQENELEEVYLKITSQNYENYNNLGKIFVKKFFRSSYLNFLKSLIKDKKFDYSVCFDCANGATSQIVKKLFKDKFKQLFLINISNDGLLVNKECGATNLTKLQQFIVSKKLDFGFAFDGDGDRIMMIDKSGKVLDGDDILYLLSGFLKLQNKLNKNTVVGTVLTNMGLENSLKSQNIALYRTDVGDKYIIEHMNINGLNLGGEPAGHIILRDFNPTGDGILTSLMLLLYLVDSGETLEKLLKKYEKYPQISVNIRVEKSQKDSILASNKLKKAVLKYNKKLGETGRLIVRASGTESLIRLMAEGKNEDELREVLKDLQNIIEEIKLL